MDSFYSHRMCLVSVIVPQPGTQGPQEPETEEASAAAEALGPKLQRPQEERWTIPGSWIAEVTSLEADAQIPAELPRQGVSKGAEQNLEQRLICII